MTNSIIEGEPKQPGHYVAYCDTGSVLPFAERRILYFAKGSWYYSISGSRFTSQVMAHIGPLDNYIFPQRKADNMHKKPASKASSSAAKSLGSKGGKKGGPARAKALPSSERSRIASEGGKAKAAKKKSKM